MERKSIFLSRYKKDSIDSLVNVLDANLSASLVTRIDKTIGDSNIVLAVFEKFYFRVGSFVSLTVLMSENDFNQKVELIGSGGGAGLIGIDWGANQSFATAAKDILIENGFTEVE